MGSSPHMGSQVTTRRSSRMDPRQASVVSSSLVGLPGAGTFALLGNDFDLDSLDPALFEDLPKLDDEFFKDFIAPDEFQPAGFDAFDMPTTNVDAAHPNNTAYLGQDIINSSHHDFGMNLVPVDSSHQDQPNSHVLPIDPTFDVTTLDPQYTDMFPGSLHPSTGLSAVPGGNYYQPHLTLDDDYTHAPSYVYPAQASGYKAAMPVIDQTNYFQYPYQHAPATQEQPAGLGLDISHLYPSRRSSRGVAEAPRRPKRTRDRSDSSSEEDAPIIKRRKNDRVAVSPKATKPRLRSTPSDHSRRSSVLSAYTDGNQLDEPVDTEPIRAGQKPKRHEEKSWVRINTSTKGETTRTARINQLAETGLKYQHQPLPVGNWQSSGFKFEYTHHLGMDEFKKNSMSARQVHEYITQFPGDSLRIWIQIAPGDSARRYASESHSRCIFEQCPNRKWGGKATIEVGSYRVAFDEKHRKYGKGVCDPFDCVGYAHLYCMERFLDFAGVCETANVKVDDRSGLKKEPKAVAAFTFLNNKHVYDKLIVEKFIKAAHAGALHRTPEFRNYPNHCDYTRGEAKPHANTLVAALYKTNLAHRTRSQIKQFVNRKILPGVFPIHHGDQEMANIDKMVAALPLYQTNVETGRHQAGDMSSYYDRFFPEVNIRIQECLELRAKLKHEDETFGAPTRGGSKKRKLVAVEYSDDEPEYPSATRRRTQSIPRQQQASRLRSSPRTKQRIDYAEGQQQHDDLFSRIPQLLPPYSTNDLQPQPSPTKRTTIHPLFPPSPTTRNTSINAERLTITRNESCSQFFLDNPDIQPFDFSTLDALTPTTPSRQQQQHHHNQDQLTRRKSSTLSNGPTPFLPPPSQITPRRARAAATPTRTASFHAQPVSSKTEFASDDPPNRLNTPLASASSPRAGGAAAAEGAGGGSYEQRRSTRIASRIG